MIPQRFKFLSVLLLLVCHIYSAEKAIKPYDPSDERCLQVARYLRLTGGKIDQAEQEKRKEFLSRKHTAVQKVKNYLRTIDSDMDEAVAFLNQMPKYECW